MKVISIHSHKGGAGKTTLCLILAKAHAMSGARVCAVDLDFVGAGFDHILNIPSPRKFLDDYVLKDSGDSDAPKISDMLTHYTDKQMNNTGFDLIYNLGGSMTMEKQSDLSKYMAASEPLQGKGIIGERIQDLLEELSAQYDLALLDCHPGLAYLSRTVLGMARDGKYKEHFTLFVTTPNRAHFFGTIKDLKYLSSKEGGNLFQPDKSVFCLNFAPPGKAATWNDLMDWIKKDKFQKEQNDTIIRSFQEVYKDYGSINYLWLKEQRSLFKSQLIASPCDILLPHRLSIKYTGQLESKTILSGLGE